MFKNQLFYSFHSWKVCMLAGVKKLLWGLWRIITCVIFGIISIFAYCGRQIEAFCRREPIAATIIAITFTAMAAGWLYTFVQGRAQAVTIQHTADSLSYSLDKIMQPYDSVIVDGDTIKSKR